MDGAPACRFGLRTGTQKPDGLFDQLIKRAEGGSLLGRLDWPRSALSIVPRRRCGGGVIELAAAETAGKQCSASRADESLTVGELREGIGAAIGRPSSPDRDSRAAGRHRTVDRVEPRDRGDGSRRRPAPRSGVSARSSATGFWFDTYEVPPRLHPAAQSERCAKDVTDPGS